MPKYTTKFNITELNKFNLIENEDIRKSSMSIYSYMLKLNDKQNKEYISVGINNIKSLDKLNISFTKFLKLYNRSHEKISLTTLKNRVETLEKYKLIIIDKTKKVNIYSFSRFFELTNNMSNEKVAESIQSASSKDDNKKHKSLNTLYKDLDSNNSITINNFDYENYICKKEKVTSWTYICNIINTAFKMLKVRSNWIKGQVISKLEKYYTNICKEHAFKYICKVIKNAREQYYSNYVKYVLNNQIKNIDSFNNYPQREYDFIKLENSLLGITKD